MDEKLKDNWCPTIVAFLCNWCSYAGADLAGTSRLQYPPSIRIIRVPCSGRINPQYIIRALVDGADGVLVSGCHPGDCHYLTGNMYARRRFVVLKRLLDICGFEPERVQFTWVSASEGGRFAQVVESITDTVRKLGPALPGDMTAVSESNNRSESVTSVSLTDFDYRVQESKIRMLSEELLSSGKVDVVLGFREDTDDGAPVPLFARTREDLQKLVWNRHCWRNLSPYLKQLNGKAAIIAKPCDSRAIVNLLVENQLSRENIVIIGVECNGMLDLNDMPIRGCEGCPSKVPPVYDHAVASDGGNEFMGLPSPADQDNSNDTRTMRSVHERRARFLREIDKCILCYTCRQTCPGCYCAACFTDRKMTNWHQADADLGEKIAFHLTRAMHLAGRCVSCGACENVCPSGVNLKYIYDGINDFINDQYGYRAGIDPEVPPAMSSYSTTDREIGFLGGERP